MLRTIVLALGLALATACTSPDPDSMAVERDDWGGRFPGTVALAVGQGETGARWHHGAIEPDELAEAIRLTLEHARMFTGFATADEADYVLAVDVVYSGAHPGFNITAWIEARWSLRARATDRTLFQREIETRAQATGDESLNAGIRRAMAIERAGQANIVEALVGIAEASGSSSD